MILLASRFKAREEPNSITCGLLLYPGKCHQINLCLQLDARTSRAALRPSLCRQRLVRPAAASGRPELELFDAPMLPLLFAPIPALAFGLPGREERLHLRLQPGSLPHPANFPAFRPVSVHTCPDGPPLRRAVSRSPCEVSWFAFWNSNPRPENPS